MIIDKANEYLSSKYLKMIIKLFSATKQSLKVITRNATFNELEEIYKAISEKQQKQMNQQKNDLFDANHFNKLPTGCFQNIIGACDRDSIELTIFNLYIV